jgi:hypothetical protein
MTGTPIDTLIELKRLWLAATAEEKVAFMDWILNQQTELEVQ